MSRFRTFSLALLLLGAWLAAAPALAASLVVHFFDVGQGDSALIVSPAGKSVLIDAGPPSAGEVVEKRLKELLSAPLDLALATHVHADHLGGMERALQALGAALFMEPGFDHPSPLYAQLLRTLEAKRIPLKIGEAGRTIDLGGGAALRVLAPRKPFLADCRSDVNANSMVLRLTYGKTAFYFAGDSERETEQRILASGEMIASQVYKVAHHGGRFSSGSALVERVRPEIAVVSVGADNGYAHPSREVIDRLEDVGARVFRTDLDGDVTVRSDGTRLSVSTSRGAEERVAGAGTGGEAGRSGMRPATAASSSGPGAAGSEAVPAATAGSAGATPRLRAAHEIDAAFEGGGGEGDADEGSSPAAASRSGPAAGAPSGSKRGDDAPAGGYVGARSSDVFHHPSCRWARAIKPTSAVYFPSREAALEAGRRPAKDCEP